MSDPNDKGWAHTGDRPFGPLPTVVLYGMPPEETPRDPFAPAVGVREVPDPTLQPCPTCKRHIYVGTPCPFCFAEAIAKAPSRAALEEIKKTLETAQKSIEASLAAVKKALGE